jgi:hypothetical protein
MNQKSPVVKTGQSKVKKIWPTTNIDFLLQSLVPSQHSSVVIHSCPILPGCICSNAPDKHKCEEKFEYEKIWRSMIDIALCLCLKERDDRLLESATQFHEYGLCRIIHYLRSDRPSDAECAHNQVKSKGRFGCWEMHTLMSIITKEFYQTHRLPTHQRYLRFEDDLYVLKGLTPLKLQNIMNAFTKSVLDPNLPWHVFKLGQLTRRGIPIDRSCHIFQARSLWTHAMILSESGNDLMAKTNYKTGTTFYEGKETDLDVWIRDYWMSYACFPQIVSQSESMTSNTGNNMSMDSFLRTKVYPLVTTLHRHFSFALDVGAYFIIPILLCMIAMFMLYLGWMMLQLIFSLRNWNPKISHLLPSTITDYSSYDPVVDNES